MWTASRIGSLGVGLALACLCGTLPADAARKARGCTAGRFVVTQGQDLLGGASVPAVLVVDGTTLSVEGPCPAEGKARTRRKGTRLSARWEHCGELKNVRLRARARDCGEVRGKLRTRSRRVALVAAPSACGDGMVDVASGEECDGAETCGEGVQCDAACRCDGAVSQPLECDTLGYPCAWSDVPAAVMQRSVELANQAGTILDGGGTTTDAAQALDADSLAELQYDERVVRFRLPGGRPVWLGKPGALDPSPDPPPSKVTIAAAPRAPAPALGAITPRSVVSPGQLPKTAYVLDPFGFQPALAGRGAALAGVIGGISGYEGNVTYVANASADDYAVAVHEFTRFAGYNVVHVLSHGATICEDIHTEAPTPCRGIVAVHQVGSPAEVSLEVGSDKGLDFLRYSDDEWWIVATADFFRDHYPGGLRDAMVVFDSCQSDGTDLAGALEGPRSNYVGWSDNVSVAGGAIVMDEFLTALGQGRAIEEVWQSMGSRINDRGGSRAQLIIGDQNIRIRELPRVIDAATGQPLTSSGTVQVTGRTDDGEPDSLLLDTEFQGISATEGELYTVHFSIDGTEFFAGPVIEFAQRHNDYRWTGSGQFDLGYDVAEGQPLDIEVTVDLPEGGTSVYAASPTATSPHWSPGRVWHGTFTKVTNLGFATTTLVVEATFERNANDSPTTKPTFHLTSGTMSWSLLDAPGDSCTRTMPSVTSTLVEDASDTITFDLTKNPVEYRGFATSSGDSVEVIVSCPWGDSVTHMNAGGTWFVATDDDHLTVSGDDIIADFAPNAVSHHLWTATKVE